MASFMLGTVAIWAVGSVAALAFGVAQERRNRFTNVCLSRMINGAKLGLIVCRFD